MRWPKEEEKSTIDAFPIDPTIEPNMLSPIVLLLFSEQELPKRLYRWPKLPERMLILSLS